MWYQKSWQSVIKELKTDEFRGLTRDEAKSRLQKYGLNILPSTKPPPIFLKFVEQFKSFLVIILILATFVSFALGEIIDAIAIAAIVLINATIGFFQEVQAEKTLESLKEIDVVYATVLRERNVEKIPVREIVPGDILLLEEGAKIGADSRIIESFSLRVDESILTGESNAVNKDSNPIGVAQLSLGDQKNLVFKDTVVVAGRGKAIVFATGLNSEIGKIATALEQTASVKTPLTIELEKIGKSLTHVVILVACVIFLLNILQDVKLVDSLLISISLAVAAIPEGLPAIVTIVLSLGVKRLAIKKTIVKKLTSVETLGAVRVIATDKTGTLTENKINVVKIILDHKTAITIEGEGYKPTGIYLDKDKKVIDPKKNRQLMQLLTAAVLSSNATYDNQKAQILGDTTEGALLVAAARANLSDPRALYHKIYEVPFSSETKMMSVIVTNNHKKEYFLYAKGAPEILVDKCNLLIGKKQEIMALTNQLAKKALRSLAVGFKKLSDEEVKKIREGNKVNDSGLTYLGIFGMQDRLRAEVKDALSQAKQAGIRTIMITGDHKDTAAAIAVEAGIIAGKDKILSQIDIDKLSVKQLAQELKNGINVFARISPLGKLKIIEAIMSLPNTQVAVTGDGVNDAPALKAAHIGIAMGRTGTDLTREVADMVITDDNYATIISAVSEGRVIFANLVKFIRYLISCNVSEVLVVTLAVVFQTPLPLLPIQILWINLITDGLPALALGVDPPEFDVMKRPPRNLSLGILHKKRWAYMIVEGAILGATTFLLFLISRNLYTFAQAQTMTFTALAFAQLVHAFNNRSTRKSLFQIGILTNKFLVGAVAISVFLQILVVQSYWGNVIFKTAKLTAENWILTVSIAFIPFIVVELKKLLRFRLLP